MVLIPKKPSVDFKQVRPHTKSYVPICKNESSELHAAASFLCQKTVGELIRFKSVVKMNASLNPLLKPIFSSFKDL